MTRRRPMTEASAPSAVDPRAAADNPRLVDRLLTSAFIPGVLVAAALVGFATEFVSRPSLYLAGTDVGPRHQWGSPYLTAWSAPRPTRPVLYPQQGDIVSTDGARVSLLNSDAEEDEPSITGDGRYLVFTRRSPSGDHDLYWSRREGQGYSPPERFPAPVNGSFNERSPSAALQATWAATGAEDEYFLLFASNRAYGSVVDHDLYLTRGHFGGEWSLPERVEPLSSAADERGCALHPDAGSIAFTRPGPTGLERFESWRLPDGSWSEPRPMPGGLADGGAWLSFAHGGTSLIQARGEEWWETHWVLLRELPRPTLTAGLWALLLLAAVVLLILRLLAHRWPALELIYRCLLISAVLHFLLWLWLRDEPVEGDIRSLSEATTMRQAPSLELAAELFAKATHAHRETAFGDRVTPDRFVAGADAQPSATEHRRVLRTPPASHAAELILPDREAATLPSVAALGFATPERAPAAKFEPAPLPQRSTTQNDRNRETAWSPSRQSQADFALPLPKPAVAARAERALAENTDSAAATRALAPHFGTETHRVDAGRTPPKWEPTSLPLHAALHPPRSSPRDDSPADPLAIVRPPAAVPAVTAAQDSTPHSSPVGMLAEEYGRPTERALSLARAPASALPPPTSTLPAPPRAGPQELATSSVTGDLRVARSAPEAARLTPERAALTDPSLQPPLVTRIVPEHASALTPPLPAAEPWAAARVLAHDATHARASTPSLPLAAERSLAVTRSVAPPSSSLSSSAPRVGTSAALIVPLLQDPTPFNASTRFPPSPPSPHRSAVAAAPAPFPSSRTQVAWVSARSGARKQDALTSHGGDANTEIAVARGLEYLATRQRNHGGFGALAHQHAKYGEVTVGKSALALLAFLGAGHHPQSNTVHSEVTASAVRFLLTRQEANGHFGANTTAYSHAIATYALGEAYLLSPDPALREPLALAARHILDHQVGGTGDSRLDGGWNYYSAHANALERTSYPRVSITAWQIMALETALLAGLEVPSERLDLARSFLIASWNDRYGRFLYTREPERLNSRYPTLPGSTPAATFALQILGVPNDDPVVARGLRFVSEHLPGPWRAANADAFVAEAEGNPYFWYYGTLATFLAGGEAWTRWNQALKEALIPSQADDGSWPIISPYAEYAADTDDDRVYTTALNVLMLEIYYRYLTPFQRAEAQQPAPTPPTQKR
ncbi:MAG: hypothetical protein AB7O52_13775 [Planctomycetota bacterium]